MAGWCFVILGLVLTMLSIAHCDPTTNSKTTCAIQEPIYNTTYDLTGLQSDLNSYITLENGSTYAFQICSKSSRKCNGQENVSACWTFPNQTEVILGLAENIFEFSNGQLNAKFVGEKCTTKPNQNFTLNVILQCQYATGDPITLSQQDECDTFLVFRSEKACQSVAKKTKCDIQVNKNWRVDLASLSKENRVSNSTEDGEFLINICNPVIFGPGALCPPGSSVCFHDKKKNVFTDYGNYDGDLHSQDNQVFLRLKTIQVCEENRKMNISSLIAFNCDEVEGKISYNGFHACAHYFTWPTPSVCQNVKPCVVVDPRSGFKFDFKRFSSKSYNVTHNNKTYRFGICSEAGAKCLGKVGACSEDGKESLGIANDILQFEETGVPFLNYTDGHVCTGNQKWYTRIEFGCANSSDEEGKTNVLENTDCRLIIQFNTQAACQENQVSCRAMQNGVAIEGGNVSPLIKYNDNYVADVSDDVAKNLTGTNYKYFLNVCRPLNPQYGLSCKGGSAACRASMVNGKGENETSLGFPDVSLTLVNTSNGRNPQLKYFKGTICATPNDNFTSTINFVCQKKAGRGNPKLVEITDECQHIFEWETNVVCPREKISFVRDTCTLEHKDISAKFSLKTIEKNGTVQLNNKTVDLCAVVGDIVEVDYEEGIVVAKFTSTETCGNQTTELRLECRDESGIFSNSVVSQAFVSSLVCDR